MNWWTFIGVVVFVVVIDRVEPMKSWNFGSVMVAAAIWGLLLGFIERRVRKMGAQK